MYIIRRQGVPTSRAGRVSVHSMDEGSHRSAGNTKKHPVEVGTTLHPALAFPTGFSAMLHSSSVNVRPSATNVRSSVDERRNPPVSVRNVPREGLECAARSYFEAFRRSAIILLTFRLEQSHILCTFVNIIP